MANATKVREIVYYELEVCPMTDKPPEDCQFCPHHALPYVKGNWAEFLICKHEDAINYSEKET